jgi:hypothetical protein
MIERYCTGEGRRYETAACVAGINGGGAMVKKQNDTTKTRPHYTITRNTMSQR